MIVDAANLANLRDRDTIKRRKLLTLMFDMGDRFLDCIYEIDNSDCHAIKMYTHDDAWLVNAKLSGDYQIVFDNLIRIENVA